MSSFCIAKATHIFADAENTFITTVNKFVINELIKLQYFEQLGPGVVKEKYLVVILG